MDTCKKILAVAVVASVVTIALAGCSEKMKIGPVTQVGSYGFDQGPTQGYYFKGYTTAQATPHYSRRTGRPAPDHFEEGTVLFGEKEFPLYFTIHLTRPPFASIRAGGQQEENSYQVGSGYIYMAKTNKGGTLYFCREDYDIPLRIVCFGYRPGSSQIERYFDTDDLTSKPSKGGMFISKNFKEGCMEIHGDTIEIPYGTYGNEEGKLVYKWDYAGNRFIGENVAY